MIIKLRYTSVVISLMTILSISLFSSCQKCAKGGFSKGLSLCELEEISADEIINVWLSDSSATANGLDEIIAYVKIPSNVKDEYRKITFSTNFGTIDGGTGDESRQKEIIVDGSGNGSVRINVGDQVGYNFWVTAKYSDSKLSSYGETVDVQLAQVSSQFCLALSTTSYSIGYSCSTGMSQSDHLADGYARYYLIAKFNDQSSVEQRSKQKFKFELNSQNAGNLETRIGGITKPLELNPNLDFIEIPYYVGLSSGSYTATATLMDKTSGNVIEYHIWEIDLSSPTYDVISLGSTPDTEAGDPIPPADGTSQITLVATTPPNLNENGNGKVKFTIPDGLGKFLENGSGSVVADIEVDGTALATFVVGTTGISALATAEYVVNGTSFSDQKIIKTRQMYASEVLDVSYASTVLEADGVSTVTFVISLNNTINNVIEIIPISGAIINLQPSQLENFQVFGSSSFEFKVSNKVEFQGVRIKLNGQSEIDTIYRVEVERAYADEMFFQPNSYQFEEGVNTSVNIQLSRGTGTVSEGTSILIDEMPYQIDSLNNQVQVGQIPNGSWVTDGNGLVSNVLFSPLTTSQGLINNQPIYISFKTIESSNQPMYMSRTLTLYP